jgi:hypothetical protein
LCYKLILKNVSDINFFFFFFFFNSKKSFQQNNKKKNRHEFEIDFFTSIVGGQE